MQVHVGKDAHKRTWQADFLPQTMCVHCGGRAELAFVAYEGLDGTSDDKDENGYYRDSNGQPFIATMRPATHKDGHLWLHDCCAVAVYFCRDCLEPTAKYNQG